MKAKKLAIIAITLIIVTLVGCDEAAMIDDLVINGLTEEAGETIQLAELKQTGDGTAAVSTHPNPNREKILSFPNPGDEGFDEWHALVLANAVNVNVLDIAGCTPNPLVIEVGLGESIEIKNSDSTISHTLGSRGNSITIPTGGSRGIVVSEFVKVREGDGIAGYACGYACIDTGYADTSKLAGIFRINSKLTVKSHEKQRFFTVKVIGFVFSDDINSPGLEGVRVTTLEGKEVTKKTAIDGTVSFKRDLPLTIQLEKEGYTTTEVTVTEEGEEILLSSEEPTVLSPRRFPRCGYEVVECDDFTNPFTQFEPIGCDGQRITGHRMLGDLDQWNQETVAIEFYTDQPTPKPLFGFMPKAVVSGNVDIVDMFCVYWRDEVEVNLKSALAGNRNGLLALQRSSHIDLEPDERLVMVYRPYSTVHGQDGQGSVREMNLHVALVDYLHQEFKVNLFNVYGGSADGGVAIAVAQHRPELVATVGISAAALSVNTWDGYNEVGPTPPWVYDPWDYVENLPPDLPILTVYDLKDKVVPNEGILPFFEKTDKRNLPLVKLVLIDSDDQRNHHVDMVQLFEILTRPENKDFHPAR